MRVHGVKFFVYLNVSLLSVYWILYTIKNNENFIFLLHISYLTFFNSFASIISSHEDETILIFLYIFYKLFLRVYFSDSFYSLIHFKLSTIDIQFIMVHLTTQYNYSCKFILSSITILLSFVTKRLFLSHIFFSLEMNYYFLISLVYPIRYDLIYNFSILSICCFPYLLFIILIIYYISALFCIF